MKHDAVKKWSILCHYFRTARIKEHSKYIYKQWIEFVMIKLYILGMYFI